MTKIFCDRCGRELPKKNCFDMYAWITHRCFYATLRMISSRDGEPVMKSDDKYICSECENSYIHWFMNSENAVGGDGND